MIRPNTDSRKKRPKRTIIKAEESKECITKEQPPKQIKDKNSKRIRDRISDFTWEKRTAKTTKNKERIRINTMLLSP